MVLLKEVFKTRVSFDLCQHNCSPVNTGRKLNVHKTFRRRPGRLLNVLCAFNLGPVSAGKLLKVFITFSLLLHLCMAVVCMMIFYHVLKCCCCYYR